MDLDDQELKIFRKFMALILSINRYEKPAGNPWWTRTLMRAYLNMNNLWKICSEMTIPVEPKPMVSTRTVDGQMQQVSVPPSEEVVAEYNAQMATWKLLNAKALGAITLHLAPSLHCETQEVGKNNP